MSHPARRAELFTVEAEEFLADLELLTGSRDLGDPERLVRGARSLRGAAMFAGFGTYARAAAGLEALARLLRSGGIEWDPSTREEVAGAVTTLREMLPHGAGWDAAADREALALAERLERFAGGGGRPQQAPAALTSGVRAFIARESAMIAGSLERAARALSPLPPADALAAVLERMRSLRGLGASADLSPLPEMLDAMEIATRMLLGDDPPPPDVAEVFDEAARALAAMAREIADTGRVLAPPELDRVALHLLSAYAEERDVVTMAELAPDGEASILHEGVAPMPPADAMPVPIEMVGVGDHLLLMADTLARPALPVVRDLRLFVLHRTLATMPSRSATAQFLQPLTAAVNGAIAHRIAGRQLDRFITMLRDCGRFLIDSGSSQNLVTLRHDRDQLVAVLLRGELGAALAAPRTTAPPVAEVTVDRIKDARQDVEEEIVSIASLAPMPSDAGALPLVVHDEADADPGLSLADFSWDIAPMEAIIPDPEMMRREREAAERAAANHPAPPFTFAEPDDLPLGVLPPSMLPTVPGEPVSAPVRIEPVMPEPVMPEPVLAEPVLAAAPPVAIATAQVMMDTPDAIEDSPIVPIESLLLRDDTDMDDLVGTPIVPIEALMFASERPVHAGLIPRAAPGQPSRLETALRGRRERELATVDEEPSLDRLIDQEVIPIDRVLYRGPAALARAAELHAGIAARLREPALSLGEIRDELEELLDLVALARDAA